MPAASVTLGPDSSDTGSRRPAPSNFRADIQALRAIAVLLVFAYHLRPNRVPGGYIGVDVFFVVSGFLITSHIIRDVARTGRVNLGAFWAARARRILPASLVALAATILLTAWLAPVTLLDDLRRHALGSIFYVENWVLAGDAVDYSAAENEATAFQHFWSLSVEEQFYLFWPLLVFAVARIVARRGIGTTSDVSGTRLRGGLFVVFSAVIVASLAYSVFTVADGRADAYFITTTRIWELAAGGLLASLHFARLARGVRYLLAYAGLGAIMVSAFLLTNQTPFPGLAAVPVIAGTVAVIMAGTAGRDEAPVSPSRYDPWGLAARWRLSQWIGDRSYSLYLWHFPVIVLWPMAADRDLDRLDLIGMTLTSLVLAHLSYRFIEQPVRRARFFAESTRNSLIAGLASMLVVAALTFAYPLMTARVASEWRQLAAEARELPAIGAAAVSDGTIPTFSTDDAMMTPSPLDASQDRNIAFSNDECVSDTRSKEATLSCTTGEPGVLSVVLVGDSHARMYSTALARMAEDEGWFLRTYLRNTCPFNPEPRETEAEKKSVCTKPNAEVLEKILADPPDLVITTWSAAGDFVDDGSATAPGAAGFAQYWNALEDAGIQVLVLRDIPRMGRMIPNCVAEHYDTPTRCGVDLDQGLLGEDVLADAVEMAPQATVADFTDVFCSDSRCKPVIGNVIVYSDHHHLTDTFAVTMIPRLKDEVERALD